MKLVVKSGRRYGGGFNLGSEAPQTQLLNSHLPRSYAYPAVGAQAIIRVLIVNASHIYQSMIC